MQQIYSIRENDIFISYAPANLLFVKKLDTAIRSLGHDPWIDLEDLPIGIDLNQSIVWQYIKAGIQNANIFVFVLSSAFCQSPRNLEELELARQTGRRLVPVRLEAIDPADLPSCLNGLPQIIVNSDQPDATIDRMAQVIVYLHTYERLQQKAQDWATKTQDYETETDVDLKADKADACQLALLRGTDLESVESWVEQGEDLERDLRFLKIVATPLQNQYIAASRAADQAYKKHTEIDSIYRPSYETYDVFISYSRRDKAAFVERLCGALQEQGKKVWVDWQNIPVAAPWRQQIREGIIGANNFLFIISADSAASKNCREELNLAIENQKRLIGIMWRSDYRKQGLFDREASLAKLKDYNWIYFNHPTQEG
ncbi:MAG TPA: toll/interleukin-1 receptor domain-containing protein, partial [Allocoleopsis sp.]